MIIYYSFSFTNEIIYTNKEIFKILENDAFSKKLLYCIKIKDVDEEIELYPHNYFKTFHEYYYDFNFIAILTNKETLNNNIVKYTLYNDIITKTITE